MRDAAHRFADLGAQVSSVSIPLHRDGIHIWNAVAVEGATMLMVAGNSMGTNWKGHYSVSLLDAYARGRLTREWNEPNQRTQTDEVGKTLYAASESADRQVVETVGRVAKRRGVPRAQVALAWVLNKPAITAPIIGASKAQHLTDALAALAVRLTAEDIAELEAPYVPHAIAGFK